MRRVEIKSTCSAKSATAEFAMFDRDWLTVCRVARMLIERGLLDPIGSVIKGA
jgi:hypothetical protein